ncbi:hypothetical protein V6N13_012008 [Hibiscus sabdariffa]|uniref:Uncharacterized protein n=1 Tax=Hibiscus sabdariffa TaxID=183260 RepID=A0ABR2SEQ8_9ROSI
MVISRITIFRKTNDRGCIHFYHKVRNINSVCKGKTIMKSPYSSAIVLAEKPRKRREPATHLPSASASASAPTEAGFPIEEPSSLGGPTVFKFPLSCECKDFAAFAMELGIITVDEF